MYELGFCYPYDSNIFWDGRNTELNNHWLTIETFTYEEIKEELAHELYELYINFYNYNNSNIVTTPQIIKRYEIDDTCLCVIKTIWLKIFQRKYKNYYNKKMKYYKNPKNIMNRSVYGKWV
tara:strand:- start:61 stop:423 length:363 start_codon:yes stop_codon:yes gene_type:complete